MTFVTQTWRVASRMIGPRAWELVSSACSTMPRATWFATSSSSTCAIDSTRDSRVCRVRCLGFTTTTGISRSAPAPTTIPRSTTGTSVGSRAYSASATAMASTGGHRHSVCGRRSRVIRSSSAGRSAD
jgi:hypothetical protein